MSIPEPLDQNLIVNAANASKVPANLERLFGFPNWCDIKTIVAVSGGPDSVALLRGLVTLASSHQKANPKNLVVAHVNHQLRGSDSDDDAEFVKNIAHELGLEFHLANPIKTASLQSTGVKTRENPVKPDTSEEHLRNFRYENLLALASEIGARYLVTGHNQDDQIETILFRIFRGTGIGGLAGIPPIRLGNDSVTIVRPLLSTTRHEIEMYLQAIGQTYRVDASNSSSRYTRNFLRNELIPLIKDRFGDSFPQSIVRLGGHAEALNQLLVEQSQPLEDSILDESATGFTVDCRVAASLNPLILQNWLCRKWSQHDWPLQAMTSSWWQTIGGAIVSEKAQILNLPQSIRFEKRDFRATFSQAARNQGL